MKSRNGLLNTPGIIATFIAQHPSHARAHLAIGDMQR